MLSTCSRQGLGSSCIADPITYKVCPWAMLCCLRLATPVYNSAGMGL